MLLRGASGEEAAGAVFRTQRELLHGVERLAHVECHVEFLHHLGNQNDSFDLLVFRCVCVFVVLRYISFCFLLTVWRLLLSSCAI